MPVIEPILSRFSPVHILTEKLCVFRFTGQFAFRCHEWALFRTKFTKMVCRKEVTKKIHSLGLCTPSCKLQLISVPRFSPTVLFISSDCSVRLYKKTDSVRCRDVGEFGSTKYSTKGSVAPTYIKFAVFLSVSPTVHGATQFSHFRIFGLDVS